jgi:hypothetical protein
MAELHRLLTPAGLLIASYTGRWSSELSAGEPWDEHRVGMNVLRHEQGWDDGGPMVLMTDWLVREHWGRAFEFVAVEPQVHGQSGACCIGGDVEVSAYRLAEPSGDPREYAAPRHSVEQLQREKRIRDEYERSLSWRATAPLRRGAADLSAVRRSRRSPGAAG